VHELRAPPKEAVLAPLRAARNPAAAMAAEEPILAEGGAEAMDGGASRAASAAGGDEPLDTPRSAGAAAVAHAGYLSYISMHACMYGGSSLHGCMGLRMQGQSC
jgi:hypothetical protein